MPSFFTVPKKRNENAQALNDRITPSPTPQAAAPHNNAARRRSIP